MRAVWRWLLGGLLAVVAILAASLWIVDTDVGHRWVAERINKARPANGLRFTVGRIDGSLYGAAVLRDVRVHDPEGLVFVAPRADLDWRPFAWLSGRLEIRSLVVPVATLAKWPRTRPTGRQGPILPDFDIVIGRLSVERLVVAKQVTGRTRYGRVNGRADIRGGKALVELSALVEGSDRLGLKIDAAPDRDRFDIDVRARGAAQGLLARTVGIRQPLSLDVGGAGRWTAWQGRAVALAGGVRVIDLAADFRLKSTDDWQQWYGMPHACPDLLAEAVYGLPEVNREAIRGARLVAGADVLVAGTAVFGQADYAAAIAAIRGAAP